MELKKNVYHDNVQFEAKGAANRAKFLPLEQTTGENQRKV